MAFKTLALCHPFIGKKVLEPDEDEGGWDTEPVADASPADLDEKAYAGYLPFIDDDDDDSNQGVGGLPRVLVTTPGLRRLFQETFCGGKEQPHRRPAMAFWALELKKAFDLSLQCHACSMSYFVDDHTQCPYCHVARASFIRAITPRGNMVIPGSATEFALPNRLFHPFSFEHDDAQEYEAVLDFKAKTAFPARGTKTFPDTLAFEFVGGTK